LNNQNNMYNNFNSTIMITFGPTYFLLLYFFKIKVEHNFDKVLEIISVFFVMTKTQYN
jgi:hypothetical protein